MLAYNWKISLRNPYGRRWWRRLTACGLIGGLALATVPAEAAWTAAIKPDPLTRQVRCLLTSETQATSDGYDTTPVTLVFDGVNLMVVTESELDPSFADLQMVVDAEPPIRSEKIVQKKMFLVFDQDIPSLVQKFRAGRQVTVYLRFWPTWPVTQPFPIRFSLIGFSKAYEALNRNCQPPAGPTPPAGSTHSSG